MKNSQVHPPKIATPEQWLAARHELLREEKKFSKLRDQLSALRRELPWVKVEKNYLFATPNGPRSLADLFEGRSQLIVYHFMLAPGQEEGCRGCSYVSDHFDGALPHLTARDVTFTAVSRAPLNEIEAFKARMGWGFNWVSSNGTDFNYDYRVSFTPAEAEKEEAEYNYGRHFVAGEEMPGLSVFAKDAAGTVYHTYSTYSRGLDLLIGAYNLLDLTPLGRHEDAEAPMKWVKHHDRYDHAVAAR